MDAQTLHHKATQAAQAAVDALLFQRGHDDNAFAYCGFAWIKIMPARGPFVKFLKDNGIGNRGWNGGYEVCPDINFPENSTVWQSMDLREAACQAYATVLKSEGLTAYAQSRAD